MGGFVCDGCQLGQHPPVGHLLDGVQWTAALPPQFAFLSAKALIHPGRPEVEQVENCSEVKKPLGLLRGGTSTSPVAQLHLLYNTQARVEVVLAAVLCK